MCGVRFFMKVKCLCVIALGCMAALTPCAALASDRSGPVVEVGWFTVNQGKSQHVGIDGLIGDDFSVSKSSDQNFLLGLGYYFNGLSKEKVSLLYGLNAFYLAPTKVSGKVTQEGLFTNLSYEYSRTNYPIYAEAKALIHCSSRSDISMNLGIGPNIVSSGSFKEKSLDGGVTIPDSDLFSRKNVVSCSATAGLGWRIAALKYLSFEIAYRFFYLGEGELKKANDQVKNNLSTGNSYANALIFSISM